MRFACRRTAAFAAAVLLLTTPGAAWAKQKKPVCLGGTWIAEGLPPLDVGDVRSLGDAVVVDLAEQTLRISGCQAVPARIKGKRNHKLKAEFPLGTCPGVEGVAKFKGSLKEACGLLKGRLKLKTKPKGKRKLRARRVEAIVPVLEEESAVEETIGPAGGSLATVDSAGRRYVLAIPEGAIPVERLVTLTPVVALAGASVDRLLGVADFEPAGLRLFPPGELQIELPEPVDLEGYVGFGYAEVGDLELVPAAAIGPTVALPVYHFSGAGSGITTGASPSLVAQVLAAQIAGDAQQVAQLCALWFDGGIQPLLASASSNVSTSTALLSFLSWQGSCQASQPQRDAQGRAALVPLLEAALVRSQADCAVLRTYAVVGDAFSWADAAVAAGANSPALSSQAVLEGTCLEVVYVDTDYPGTPQQGVSHTLSVTVGASFGGSPVFSEPLRVDVAATGATPGSESGLTDGAGNWNRTFAVTGGEDAVFQIDSCIAAPAYPQLSSICQPALVVRGLEVSPGSATIDVGASQQFEAQRFGQAYANVTWSASGGTISSAGLYSAPPAAGTYTVTATDTANPGSTATASVTVNAVSVGNCVDNPGLVQWRLGANVQLADRSEGLGVLGTTPVTRTLTEGACEVTGRAFGFGHIEATLTGDAIDCGNSTLRAGAVSIDHVRITPADPSRFVATVRGDFEFAVAGSASPSVVVDPISGSAGHLLGGWTPGGGGFATGESHQLQGTSAVELQNPPGRTWFSMAWRVRTQGLVAPSNHTVQVSASLRWLGITAILDQDGNPIVDYTYCSNSGTDYRQAVP